MQISRRARIAKHRLAPVLALPVETAFRINVVVMRHERILRLLENNSLCSLREHSSGQKRVELAPDRAFQPNVADTGASNRCHQDGEKGRETHICFHGLTLYAFPAFLAIPSDGGLACCGEIW